jgi:hypothetical protein
MSSIVVSGDTSGAITLAAPAVAGTNTLTLPANTGTVITNASAGTILQVLSATKTDVSTTTSATYADISGLSVSITPTRSTSKFLILYNIAGSNNGGGGFTQLVRNSTAIAIGTGATGSQINVTTGNYYNADTNSMQVAGGSFLDSPATASAITYKLQFRVGTTSGTFFINRNPSNDNAAYTGVATSTITVMEVAA